MGKLILAIVGLPGSGKTEATEYIKNKTGWPNVYFGQPTIDEVHKRGQELTEENEKKAREDLREQYGMAAMAILSLAKIKEVFQSSNVLLESMYSWEEYLLLKKEFGNSFKVLAVYASFESRSKRMSSRADRPLTKQQLLSRDAAQIENLHQAGPIAVADWTIVNEGSLEELFGNLDKIVKELS